MLELRPRLIGARGLPAWHDAPSLQRAIEFASKGKSMSKLAVPIAILGKIEKARMGKAVNETVEIELDGAEGRILWEMVGDLPPEAYWVGDYPPIKTIREFLDELEEAVSGDQSSS